MENDQYISNEGRPTVWEMAVMRAKEDPAYDAAMRLAGPAIVEVQSPTPERREELKAHPIFSRLCSALKAKNPECDPEHLLLWYVPVANDPPIEEMMTRSERLAIASRIEKHANGLRESLAELMQENGAYCFPIQPILSRHSVLAAANDAMRWKDSPEYQDNELAMAILHRTRFAIYDAIGGHLPLLLHTLVDAANHLAEMESKLHRPANINARRLYFLRYMTNILHREIGKPCRNIVLELASMYFDCSDLDEAAISKLAPVPAEPKTG